ncbi:MAG: DoxX family membrane protein [Anaerolineae bacterium]|nr:DoxX family membrane protein [Anaerolineae bacterium]
MLNRRELNRRFETLDSMITRWMALNSIRLLRISIGVVFVWFGALKFFPGLSPAEGLIRQALGPYMPVDLFMPVLALWEVVIGLGFITGRYLRATLLLLALQMVGTVSPVFLTPEAVFVRFPFVLTLEGQYIIKNLVLFSGALVIGATVRGGTLTGQSE